MSRIPRQAAAAAQADRDRLSQRPPGVTRDVPGTVALLRDYAMAPGPGRRRCTTLSSDQLEKCADSDPAAKSPGPGARPVIIKAVRRLSAAGRPGPLPPVPHPAAEAHWHRPGAEGARAGPAAPPRCPRRPGSFAATAEPAAAPLGGRHAAAEPSAAMALATSPGLPVPVRPGPGPRAGESESRLGLPASHGGSEQTLRLAGRALAEARNHPPRPASRHSR